MTRMTLLKSLELLLLLLLLLAVVMDREARRTQGEREEGEPERGERELLVILDERETRKRPSRALGLPLLANAPLLMTCC
jgi:hypothetical protein